MRRGFFVFCSIFALSPGGAQRFYIFDLRFAFLGGGVVGGAGGGLAIGVVFTPLGLLLGAGVWGGFPGLLRAFYCTYEPVWTLLVFFCQRMGRKGTRPSAKKFPGLGEGKKRGVFRFNGCQLAGRARRCRLAEFGGGFSGKPSLTRGFWGSVKPFIFSPPPWAGYWARFSVGGVSGSPLHFGVLGGGEGGERGGFWGCGGGGLGGGGGVGGLGGRTIRERGFGGMSRPRWLCGEDENRRDDGRLGIGDRIDAVSNAIRVWGVGLGGGWRHDRVMIQVMRRARPGSECRASENMAVREM